MNPVVRSALAEALALAFPVACCACGETGTSLCGSCALQIVPTVLTRVLPSGLPVWSGLTYAGAAGSAIRALKEEGRTGLARRLAPALSHAVDAATGGADDILFVPVPASAAAMRRRGYRVVELLLRRAALPATKVLGYTRRLDDQRALDREERWENTRSAMRVRGVLDARVIVVDDVVTTGATLREAARALEAAGATVLGGATVASTLLMSGAKQTHA